jgi:hypothetical protein
MSKGPKTAKEALELWDSGAPVPAFQVESEGADQDEIYALAFELMRGAEIPSGSGPALTDREREVAYSIAKVAQDKGWAIMVASHVGPQVPAITIQKKKAA